MAAQITDRQVAMLIDEVEARDKGAIGEVRRALRVLRVDLDAIYAEGYLLDEWHEDRGDGNLCNEARAQLAIEIIGDCINSLAPHYLAQLRTAVRAYAEDQGWPIPSTVENNSTHGRLQSGTDGKQ